ncbi:hypothetical protein H257_11758 [Aphanomyces astaci]|uniref:Uncharacterized protein n=1 Tax=Aphanomyces astaci TaxID=112090 RepID=W4G1U8_APHAT|nr:hypothetical protein H257_11758 [Aphanomyces astaci]ETV73655.1 hypothetical protein H257_11758 [Aphanomyces astaci]|eukprot:XP_009837081.1 hypothetical protein H257_11758 [Aphanomyces astaci]
MRRQLCSMQTQLAIAAARRLQAAARGFLVRHEASGKALQHMLVDLERHADIHTQHEGEDMVQHNRRVLELHPPPRLASRHTLLAVKTTTPGNVLHQSTWSLQFSKLQDMLLDQGRHMVSFEIGDGHAVALTDLGQVYTYGRNDQGQCGATISRSMGDAKGSCPRPILVHPRWFQGAKIASIATGEDHTVALTDAGVVFTWGGNQFGQLGLGHFQRSLAPQQVTRAVGVLRLRRVTSVASGSFHSIALLETGSILAWGTTTNPASTDEAMSSSATQPAIPKLVKAAADAPVKFKTIACGSSFSVAICDRGQLYSWGHDSASVGALGLGESIVHRSSPTRLPIGTLDGRESNNSGVPSFNQVRCGVHHAAAVTTCGTRVFVWGSNRHGQLGVPANQRGRWSGVRLRCIENMGAVLDVLVGSYSTAVVVSTKKGRHAVYAWGEVGQVSVLEFDKFDVSISSSPLSPDRPKSPTSQFMNDGRVLLLDGSNSRRQTSADAVPPKVACSWSARTCVYWTTLATGKSYHKRSRKRSEAVCRPPLVSSTPAEIVRSPEYAEVSSASSNKASSVVEVLAFESCCGGATTRTNTKSSVTHAEGFDQARHSNVDTNEQQKW